MATNGDIDAALSLGWGLARLTRMYNTNQNRALHLPIDDDELLAKIATRDAKNRKNATNYQARIKAQKEAAASQPPDDILSNQAYLEDPLREQAQARVIQLEAEAECLIDSIEQEAQGKLLILDSATDSKHVQNEDNAGHITEYNLNQIGLATQAAVGHIVADIEARIAAIEKERDEKIEQVEAAYLGSLHDYGNGAHQGELDSGGEQMGGFRDGGGSGDVGGGGQFFLHQAEGDQGAAD